jgi:sugar/nucleoside kinase (ribokinase family)
MLGNTGLVRFILDLADKYGTTAAIDLSSVSIADEKAAEIAGYIRQFSLILFMNEPEAEVFYEKLEGNRSEAPRDEDESPAPAFFSERRKAASRLRRGCSFLQSLTERDIFPIIVVKLGKRGALCFAGGNIYRSGTVEAIPRDTTGAGDTFCAAFLSAWVRDRSLSECTALGNKAARIVLDVEGTLVERKQFKAIAHQLKEKH